MLSGDNLSGTKTYPFELNRKCLHPTFFFYRLVYFNPLLLLETFITVHPNLHTLLIGSYLSSTASTFMARGGLTKEVLSRGRKRGEGWGERGGRQCQMRLHNSSCEGSHKGEILGRVWGKICYRIRRTVFS